jgi:hypothetical protein
MDEASLHIFVVLELGRVDVFGVLELGRIDVNVIEPWYHIRIEKAETVSPVCFEVRVVAVDSVVLGLVGEVGSQRKVGHENTSDYVLILFEVHSHL